MNDYFNGTRWLKLISNDLMLHRKAIMICAIVLLIFFSIFSYFFVLYFGGLILTSLAFHDLHDRQRAHVLLMLPCSNFEILLSKWFLTSIGYIAGTLLVYSLFLLLKGQQLSIYFMQDYFWMEIAKYMVLHAIILLGAITFKKYALIKTALFAGLFFIALSSFYALMTIFNAWVFYPSFFEFIVENMFYGPWGILFLLTAPFCWVVTYLRLTEYELN